MAHELEMINGNAVMFSARGLTPWHQSGIIVDTVANAAEAIALLGPSTVKVEKVFTQDGKAIEGQFCTRRQEDGSVFGMVSDRYHVLNDSDAFELADAIVQAGEATYETAGRLRGGCRTWLQLRLNGVSGTVGANDKIDRFLLLSNSHDGKQAVKLGFCDVRSVCSNTLAMAENSKASKLLRVRHSSKMIPALQDIRCAMDMVKSEFTASMSLYNSLAEKGITKKQLEQYVCKVYDTDPSEPPRALTQILENFTSGLGSDMAGETVYGAYQAVSDHLTWTQGRTDEGRLDAGMYGVNAQINQLALQVAQQFVTVGAF